MSASDIDPFWVKNRAEFLAANSTSADPSACGTCRGKAQAGEPVEHDECQQRATLLEAPDHPYYEILAGFSLAENEKLPARFHIPVFDDCGVPNGWHCAVCWEDGVVTGWPCATAVKYGTQVFTPLHEAETAQKKQSAELEQLRADLAAVRAELAHAVPHARELALKDAERWLQADPATAFDRIHEAAQDAQREANAALDAAGEAPGTSGAIEYGIRIPNGTVILDGVTTDRADQEARLERCRGKAMWPGAVLVQRSVSYGEWTEVAR